MFCIIIDAQTVFFKKLLDKITILLSSLIGIILNSAYFSPLHSPAVHKQVLFI